MAFTGEALSFALFIVEPENSLIHDPGAKCRKCAPLSMLLLEALNVLVLRHIDGSSCVVEVIPEQYSSGEVGGEFKIKRQDFAGPHFSA